MWKIPSNSGRFMLYCYFENQLWQNKGKWHQSLNIFWQSKSWKRQGAAKAREKSFSKSNNKRTFPCFGSVHRQQLCKSKTNFPSPEFMLRSTSLRWQKGALYGTMCKKQPIKYASDEQTNTTNIERGTQTNIYHKQTVTQRNKEKRFKTTVKTNK